MISCNYNKCNYKKIRNLDFCHLKSHNKKNNLEKYEKEILFIKEKFKKDSLPKDFFNIKKIDRDGACLFTCLALGVNKCNEDTELLAREIQETIKNWIIINPNHVCSLYNMEIKDMIPLIHGEDGINTIDEYEKYFSIYAGDELIGEEIPERWGSLLELYVFHILYKKNIKIFILKKLDKKFNIKKCTKKSKDYRFFLYQKMENKEFDEEFNEINLYYNTMYKYPHYEFLINK